LQVWSFFVDDDTTTCFVLGSVPEVIEVVSLPVGRTHIEAAMTSVRTAFNGDRTGLFHTPPIDPERPHEVDLALVSLWEVTAALQALEPTLGDGESLVIAPHGPLHGFPFAAIPLNDGRPLGVAYPVTYVPSLATLSLALTRTDPLVATPTVHTFSVTSADDPHHAVFEASEDDFPKSVHTVRVSGPEASKAAVVQALASADILHIACHGVLDARDPMASGLLLSDGSRRPPRRPATPEDWGRFVLSAREILDIVSTCRLVVLRACSSGVQGERNRGDEFEGLTRALLYAGAQRVIVSLWNVDRDSSKETFTRFYREWLGRDGHPSVASTMSTAQRSLLEVATAPWSHMYHWAPFICIGDFR
jgi:CHAT domain-containing protein